MMKKTRGIFCGILTVLLSFGINGQAFGEAQKVKKDISIDKKWTIYFNENVGKDYKEHLYVENKSGERVDVPISKKGDYVVIGAPKGGYEYDSEYKIVVNKSMSSYKGEELNEKFNYIFRTEKSPIVEDTIKYIDYYGSLSSNVEKQYNRRSAVYQKNGRWIRAPKSMIEQYMNPENFMDDEGMYQFLTLNYIDGIKAEDINRYLRGKGTLHGMGEAILRGAKKYNINPAYLIAHMILETGHGRSRLAQGITVSYVNGRKVQNKRVYNMYGIKATDANPNKYGSEYAYTQGWFSPETAIVEGAKWVGEKYINSSKYKQNTLYEMRWNNKVIWHQYSTDVRWVYNQTKRLKDIMDNLQGAKKVFEIPKYK